MDFMDMEWKEKKENQFQKNNNLIVKENYTIKELCSMDCFKSNFLLQTKKNLSVFELQVLSILISRISKFDNKEKEYEISTSEIKEYFKQIRPDINDTNINQRINKAISHIENKVNEDGIKIELPNNEYKIIWCNWFSYIQFDSTTRKYIYKWNEIVALHLFNLSENYGIQNIKELLLITKISSYRIYELIESNFDSHKINQDLEFNYNIFRNLMGWNNWSAYKIKIEIEKAKEEINRYSKYIINNYQFIKDNCNTHKNKSIKFSITHKNNEMKKEIQNKDIPRIIKRGRPKK